MSNPLSGVQGSARDPAVPGLWLAAGVSPIYQSATLPGDEHVAGESESALLPSCETSTTAGYKLLM